MDLFLIFIGGVLVNNFVMSRFLGICPFLGVSKKLETAVGMSVAVAFVMVLSSAFTYLVYNLVLIPMKIEYLYNVTFILIIAAFVQFVEMFLKKSAPALYRALGVYLPLITTNCAVLGVVVLNMQKDYGLLTGMINSFGAACGFALAISLFAGIRERLRYADVPEHFQGFPIAMITAGLMSIAFFGFSGLIR
ncbi:MAG: electron transport complex subunit RsxA [Clostridiales bacterium]|jgi:electron transport complex protein RnfA|nr:electron transport complex subunit RsxA [Clostridiales bacterium]